jgi:Ser/Thr protein kinase RdoA (MazF antagonist)
MTEMAHPQASGAMNLVAHSVLDARALASEVAARYPFAAPVTAQLMYRGMNDVYVVRVGGKRYALRAWRAVWRSLEEVAGELEFLNFLHDRGFPASYPVQQRDGAWFFTLDAPEGVRPLALYEWAHGVKFSEALSVETARRIGEAFGQLHVIGRDFTPAKPHSLKGRAVSPENLPWLYELLEGRPDEIADYRKVAAAMTAQFDRLAGSDLPDGACHGDFHPSNVHVTPDGKLTLLDFDGCGTDYLLQDVANYVFGNDFYGFGADLGQAFLDGYKAERPFTAQEEELYDFFYLSKTFRLISGIARNVNAVGQGSLKYRGLDWFAATIREKARKLGYL